MPASDRLPGPVRRLIAGVGVSSVGTGLTIPFTLILLSEVRDIPLRTTGLLLAVPGVVGLAAVPASGALIDRVGPRRVLRAGLVLQSAGNALLAVATTPLRALVGLVLLGIGLGPSFPALSSLVSSLVPEPAVQQRAFAVQFTVLNACIGLGGIAGATLVDVERPGTFVALYLANAATFLIYALAVPRPARGGRHQRAAGPSPAYREVLADRTFLRVCLTSLLFAFTGYAALDAGLPAFARVVGGVSPSVIALVFVVNTALIVLGQLLVVRLLAGRRRSSALAGAALAWALSWGVLALVPVLPPGGRVAVVLLFGALFGVGEILLAPTFSPLVNALATDRLRGRYNALSSACYSIAFVVSPAVSALLISHGLALLWLGLLVAGCAGSALLAFGLRRRLTPAQDGLTDEVEDATVRLVV